MEMLYFNTHKNR